MPDNRSVGSSLNRFGGLLLPCEVSAALYSLGVNFCQPVPKARNKKISLTHMHISLARMRQWGVRGAQPHRAKP